eukprot:GEMP01022847.1.p1 GENE.GEMP01022847.1~~GEMP01022847.1.p1  ORF type:complete len:436 (+),score=103.14 GEMP01022847.1:296-1603(+)
MLTNFPYEIDRGKNVTKQARLRYMGSISNDIRNLRRRKAFYDWKAMMEHNRDRVVVQEQRVYIDEVKEEAERVSKILEEFDTALAERDATRVEIQKKEETIERLTARLEAEIAAHNQSKDALDIERANHQATRRKLDIEKGRWARRDTALRAFMERQPAVHETLDRWRTEALVRFGFQAVILDSRRLYVIKYRALARVHEGATIAAAIEAREKRALQDNLADLEIAAERMRSTLDRVHAERNILAERYHFLQAELDSQRELRVRKDALLRDAEDTVCRVKTILREEEGAHLETRNAFLQTLDEERDAHERVTAMLQEHIVTLTSEKSALEYFVAKLKAELANCEHHCKEQEDTIAKMLLHKQKLREKYDAIDILNEELALKAQGLGPPVPAGFLCRQCQEDVQRDIRLDQARGLRMNSKVYDLLDIIQANRSARN